MISIAKQMEQALQAEGEYRAGGTDLQARRRLGLSRGAIVDIRFLEGQEEISWGVEDALSLGTLVTLHQIATDPKVRQLYPGLAQSAGGLATPQIRHMATLGGALLQHTRCPYYRQPAFRCLKKGGEGCPARDGHIPNGVVFDLGPCVYPASFDDGHGTARIRSPICDPCQRPKAGICPVWGWFGPQARSYLAAGRTTDQDPASPAADW